MIKEKEVEILITTSKNAAIFSSLMGERVNKGDKIKSPIQYLSHGSHTMITAICDQCGTEKRMMYKTYNVCTSGQTRSYRCSKHGAERLKEHSLRIYGVENPFQAEVVKEQSRQTCLKKYGVAYNTQRPEIKEQFLLEEKNYFYKNGVLKEYYYDNNVQLKEWRSKIYDKYNCVCQICGASKEQGVTIHAHHLWGYFDFPEKRYDAENGITLCQKHHMRFHWLYQDEVITPDLFEEYIKGQTTIPSGSTVEDELPLEVHCNPLG